MRVALVFLSLCAFIFAGPVPEINDDDAQAYQPVLFYEREDGTFGLEDLTKRGEIQPFVSASDLTYYFYSRNNRQGFAFRSTEVADLRSRTDYSPNKRTLFIIHGWTNHFQSPVNRVISTAALAADDINVIVVDWNPIAGRTYLNAQGSVLQVGNLVGAVITQFNTLLGQSWNTITVVGHSLGAHVAGNAGAAAGRRIGTIVGLDPAGPLFSANNINNRIDPTDGVNVKIIHTNDGMLGFSTRAGDSDFFPNGGRSQPGCGIDLAGSCAHSRAYDYYAESLTNNNFLSRNCDTYNDFTAGRCASRTTSLMGGLIANANARGDFFLTTNNNAPFSRGTA